MELVIIVIIIGVLILLVFVVFGIVIGFVFLGGKFLEFFVC